VLALKKTDREGKGGGLVRGGDGFSLSLLLVSFRFSSLLLFSCSILLGKKNETWVFERFANRF
jgi:hypothetical protein